MNKRYDVYAQHCPTRMILDRVADKWTLLILNILVERPMRFNQLKRDVEGISQKVLSQTLKNLVRDGFVERTVFPTIPVTVEYASTVMGKTLAKPIAELTYWAEQNMDNVLLSQQKFDASANSAAEPL
ncbi:MULTISPECIES: winged helix-turn-helix transcriptional regulator [Pectobacterium]|jgi:DNA-binding HxlR family transcriptional regulator|uniref:Helix-turn-helix transcriptional regulator n=2 Tax=Pectobacterium TaxID=122277 RepID=A0AAW3SVC5_9GAMM|nr:MULTISPECIES: helix-turn-helix domain-containing protein [Pectobacterium]ACT14439.1 transcriptional regulator, HxlR family [Pectobacterium carotovorum subsp. carotovorum PC1]KFF68698.1 HxlR family transcriptional regulator [Pectobacterium brasiliense]MBA0205677.1 helix-turn-helix transcriptional regulator [Pectobacterium aroidearum]MBA5205666.1 helix-turn-helix transcriptional regulator [Pectobacterium aroidearum]MBA5238574.1 helix-turn-helix transcriptional regulator [Pectobacterium aroide